MKSLKIIVVFVYSVLLFGTTAYSQSDDAVSNLTPKQFEMLEAHKKLLMKHREAFKTTLTKDQLELLKDQTKTKDERQELLMASLTLHQKRVLEMNREEVRTRRELFNATITDEQRRRLRAEFFMDNNIRDRKELRELILERRKLRRIRNN
ncbi:hypothetical protein [Lutibacter sp.]|uniref:hypothetical protein n=1 Tax=Lutibacter sp. TaxID=1925666 RepID=UPI002734CFE8|nr:hypothetical protein [Lutibacter sp.]MDP3313381.1 hypothetical protein [Lutibacter sp.]